MLIKGFLGAMVYKRAFFEKHGIKVYNDVIIFQRDFFVRTYINLYSVGTAIMQSKMYGFRDTSV